MGRLNLICGQMASECLVTYSKCLDTYSRCLDTYSRFDTPADADGMSFHSRVAPNSVISDVLMNLITNLSWLLFTQPSHERIGVWSNIKEISCSWLQHLIRCLMSIVLKVPVGDECAPWWAVIQIVGIHVECIIMKSSQCRLILHAVSALGPRYHGVASYC